MVSEWSVLFRSTIATSAPEATRDCAMTRPKPLAPPVTTATRPSRENCASVLFKCGPPLPWTFGSGGNSPVDSGYFTSMVWSVLAELPSWSKPGFPSVAELDSWKESSLLLRPGVEETYLCVAWRCARVVGTVTEGQARARVAARTICCLAILKERRVEKAGLLVRSE